MADVSGQPRPDLTQGQALPESMDFFELLRRLETQSLRFGRAGGPDREPARLGQRIRMSFATKDIGGFRPGRNNRPPEVDVEVLGLFGPEGALPLHITRWVMSRLSERWFAAQGSDASSDTTFLDFCNMLQHRMLALYWRAWADARGEVQTEVGTAGRAAATIDALAGLGLPGMAPQDDPDLLAIERRHATGLGNEVQGTERLSRFIADVIGAPVEVIEFVGDWMEIPDALQTRLGAAHAALGTSAVAGRRTFQRMSRAELRVGPVGLDLYLRLLGDPAFRNRVARAVQFAAGQEIDFDLRPVLARAAVPDPTLGQCQLGRTTWISPKRDHDASDLRLSRITATAAPAMGAAA